MNTVSISKIREIRDFVSNQHNESLMYIQIEQKDGFSRTKFVFKSTLHSLRESIDVSIYNFEDEIILKLWGEDIHKQQLTNCSKLVFDAILPRWFPSLYLSCTFLPISYPEWYVS